MVACFRIGAVVLPCTEQLRAKDLRAAAGRRAPARRARRRAQPRPSCDAAGPDGLVLAVPDERLYAASPPPPRRAAARGPVPDHVHQRHLGRAQGRRCTPSATSPASALQAEHWLDARPGDLVWCTAASGWSKSARNVFIAPWLRGAAALLHDARFDPARAAGGPRARARSNVLCMAPTEYRVIAKRADAAAGRRRCAALVAAGEALNPEVLRAWHEATGLWIRDGYGQTETGQLTGDAARRRRRGPGSMGRPLPGVRLWVDDGELVRRPGDGADVLPRLPGRGRAGPPASRGAPATASHAGRRRLPALRGPHRRRDHLGRLPHRPVRGGVGARRPPRGGRGRRRRGARRGARRRRARRGRPARRARPSDALAARAAGPRQGADRALQVPADRRLRRGAAARRRAGRCARAQLRAQVGRDRPTRGARAAGRASPGPGSRQTRTTPRARRCAASSAHDDGWAGSARLGGREQPRAR